MEAGEKAHSAPFCLLSAQCHGAEGKSRSGGDFGSGKREAVGREKEVSGFQCASREAGEAPLLSRGAVAPGGSRRKRGKAVSKGFAVSTRTALLERGCYRVVQSSGIEVEWYRGSILTVCKRVYGIKRPCHGCCFVTRSFVLVLLCQSAYAMPAVMMAIL